ncbi:hypothetical protein AB0J63_26685 [Streptosporangium canum]|uniref:hypothetical protein n=1 Tax=Streptosporangium canum TaxID=324952 RepID=UPI00342029AB
MTGWIIAATYVTGLVITARKVASYGLNEDDCRDAEDRLLARTMGFLAGLLWPLVLLMILITGRLPKTDKQLRQEHAEQAARIEELERELGIGKTP